MGKRIILIALAALLVTASFVYAETQNIKVSGDIESMFVNRNTFDLKGKNAWEHQYYMYPYLNPELPYGLGSTANTGRSDTIFLTIGRVRVDADLTDNVSATLRLIGEWIWGKDDRNNSINGWIGTTYGYGYNPITLKSQKDSAIGVDVDLAYVTLKEFLYSPLTLVIGRQELHYGNDMIIGDRDTNRVDARGNIPGDLSKRKSFDAIRAILDYNPITIDLVYSKISEGMNILDYYSMAWIKNPYNAAYERVGDRRDNDIDLYGLNAKYDFGKWNTIGEFYYWYRRTGPRYFYAADFLAPLPDAGYKSDQLHTIGARISTEPVENLIFQLEAAWQFGRANIDANFYNWMFNPALIGPPHVVKRDAWALETSLTYNWVDAKYTPSLTGKYAYFSGENQSWTSFTSGTFRGWDPMFENQTYGRISNALFPQTNMHIFGVEASFKPKEDLTLIGEVYAYRFAKRAGTPLDGWWWAPGTNQPVMFPDYYGNPNLMTDKDWMGVEIDLTTVYDYTEDVQFCLMSDIFIPGSAFSENPYNGYSKNDHIATEMIGSVRVAF